MQFRFPTLQYLVEYLFGSLNYLKIRVLWERAEKSKIYSGFFFKFAILIIDILIEIMNYYTKYYIIG